MKLNRGQDEAIKHGKRLYKENQAYILKILAFQEK